MTEACAQLGAAAIGAAREMFANEPAFAFKTAKAEMGTFLALIQTFESLANPSKPHDADGAVREILSILGHDNTKQILMSLRPPLARLLNAINEMEKP